MHGNGPTDSPGLAPAGPVRALMHWTRLDVALRSSTRSNLNPLRDVLEAQIDFDRLRLRIEPHRTRLFVAATHASTGRLRLFGNAERERASRRRAGLGLPAHRFTTR